MPPDIPDSTLDFARLRTPPGHGDVLVEPRADVWGDLAHANHHRLAALDCRILDLTGGELRHRVRRAAGVASDEIAFVSGHEPELTHPGVLAKHVLADRLARSTQGQALNLIVDHDSPKHTMIDVPTIVEGRLTVRSLAYLDPPRGRAFESIPPVIPAGWSRLEHELRACLGERFESSLLPVFLGAARDTESPRDWVDQWAAGRRAVEHAMGIRTADHRTSRLWPGPLLAQMIVDARRLAACYNAALSDHRRRQRIRGTHRPIPDLAVDSDRTEVPAWVYRRGEPRQRLFVSERRGRVELFAGLEPLGALDAHRLARWEAAGPALQELEGVVFRPRALTLTLWARLFVADLFIHGIGGAKYDGITDALIRDYFGVAPPAMTCVSATLLLDLPRHDVPPDALAAARRSARDLHYNPQRYVPSGGAYASLLEERARAVALSSSLRSERPGDHAARRHAFMAIRDLNERIVSSSPEVAGRLRAQLEWAERETADNRVADRRDYFFGLFRRERLQVLLDRLSARMSVYAS